ncbi:YitT family protein [Pseudacidovorax intermedius]|uniref:YitT family protein n=1 Tax=Pseudacidovorax intermedius TaxID=433924 RepID=UPI0005BB3F26|nr:YitT family protein [Pseudacidovorax intermedius]
MTDAAAPVTPAASRTRHALWEDALAIASGTLLISMGVALFTTAGLLTGGTAGIAFLLHYGTGASFGTLFFLLNLPFYWLAWRKLGAAFTVKTFLAVASLSLLTLWQPGLLHFDRLQPLYAALAGGLVTGTGFLILFRHRCSLGGIGILAVWLQEKKGWRAGQVQMGFDCIIVATAFALVEPQRVMLSIAGAIALNAVLAINHKPGRYLGF